MKTILASAAALALAGALSFAGQQQQSTSSMSNQPMSQQGSMDNHSNAMSGNAMATSDHHMDDKKHKKDKKKKKDNMSGGMSNGMSNGQDGSMSHTDNMSGGTGH